MPRDKASYLLSSERDPLMTSTILIQNMTCGGCAKGVLATIRAAAPEARAEPDVVARRVTVAGAVDPAALVAALRADGWDATAAG